MGLRLSIKLILLAIIVFAAIFRFYGLNWDQGYHLHPDERAIIMTTEKLSFPQNIKEFLSPTSFWNPSFFAYGSLPFYFLYFIGQLLIPVNPEFAAYSLMNLPGRFISGLSDLVTILIIFLIGRKLFNKNIGLLSAFLYAVSVLPIQLSHFYAVDTLLTMFIAATLYQLVLFYENPTIKKSLLIGLFFGLALATKISAFVLIVSVGMVLVVDFLLILLKYPHKPKHWIPHLPKLLKNLSLYAVLITIATVVTFIFFEPYAFIDFNNFWLQTMQQQAMTKDAFTFPYTLQYVGKIPYIYELKNIFFFGLGPVIAILSFVGFCFFVMQIIKKDKKEKWAQEIILLIFFAAYFFVVGKFAIGFMRYMLPLYPFFCLFAAIIVHQIFILIRTKNKYLFFIFSFSFLILVFVWPLSFIQIYNHNNTRVDATNWILENIPQGKMLLVEHWDDRLPIYGSENYQIEDLELYNPDTTEKWQEIDNQLMRANYIIIASNRLHAPLQKLTNCKKLPVYRCYPKTAIYYKELFAGKLGFQKIVEFSNYPTIPFLNLKFNDQGTDESFTVYDHPKIMIFEKL